jgi:hypothetical protein
MIGLRQPVLDAIPEADAIEHLEAQRSLAVVRSCVRADRRIECCCR